MKGVVWSVTKFDFGLQSSSCSLQLAAPDLKISDSFNSLSGCTGFTLWAELDSISTTVVTSLGLADGPWRGQRMSLRSLSPLSPHTRLWSRLPSLALPCIHSSNSEQNNAAPEAPGQNPLDGSDFPHMSQGRSEAHAG